MYMHSLLDHKQYRRNMQNRRYRRDKPCGQYGFTLIEILVAMAIGMTVIGALTGTFISQRKAYDIQQQITEAVQMARAAMDMVHREVRLAGYDPTGADFDGIPISTTQLQILADLDGDGVTTGSSENITYKYYDETDQIKRKTGSGYFQPFAENVQEFTFAILDGNDNTATDSADIRKVKITITVRTDKPDPNYASNNGYRTMSLTSYVTPRNLIY